jgi:hypothetical protein
VALTSARQTKIQFIQKTDTKTCNIQERTWKASSNTRTNASKPKP